MLIEIRNRGQTPIKFISITSNSTFFWSLVFIKFKVFAT